MKRPYTEDNTLDLEFWHGLSVPPLGGKGSGGSNIRVQAEKDVSIPQNGEYQILPDDPNEAIGLVNLTVNCPGPLPEIDLTTTLTSNTTTVITPSQGSVLTSLSVITNVNPPLENKTTTIQTPTHLTITKSNNTYYGLNSIDLTVPFPNYETQLTNITSNGTYTLQPTTGKNAITSATINVNVPEIPSIGTVIMDSYSITLSTTLLNNNATINSYACDLVPLDNNLIMEKGCFIHQTNGYIDMIYQSTSTPSISMTTGWYVLLKNGDPFLSGSIGQLSLTTDQGPLIIHTIPTGAIEDYLQFPTGYLQLIVS